MSPVDERPAEEALRRRRRGRQLKRALRLGLVLWGGAFVYLLVWHEPAYQPEGFSFVEISRDGQPRYLTPWAAVILYTTPFAFGIWALISRLRERAHELRWKE